MITIENNSDSSHLPQSDARCEPLDELKILESFPLEAGEEGKYEALEDENLIEDEDDNLNLHTLLIGRTTFGKVSWYGKKFHGRKTANGERYNMHKKTAAHKELPFNSLVKVTNKKTGKSETVRINDRGPYHGNRILDVSYAVAKTLGLVQSGVATMKLEILKIGFDPRCQQPR
ncbi:septal ring lytic transglycosylase RlpA family protein [bacterium]|nr:septal ring lytic transglycosylase RlpA family protein [bacterium]MBU1959126.1 septal ring lytic transglycosylase RlpA family protein [bacterium]